MKFLKLIAAISFITCSVSGAQSRDVALLLSEDEQRDLFQVLDGAAKGQGIALATQVSHILEKLKVAPSVVAESKEGSPAGTPREGSDK